MKYINSSLITLKCVLFLFFGAVGSLFPFLPLHMTEIGLSKDEAVIISIVAAILAAIGPLVAAPVADRLAGGFGGSPRSKTGWYLRVMIAVCLIVATIFYWLLLLVPPIIRGPPSVSFVCDPSGGFILQDRCGGNRTCYKWGSSKGSVLVKNCQFSCNASTSYSFEYTTPIPDEDISSESPEYYDINGPVEPPALPTSVAPTNETKPYFVPHPHMCYKNDTGTEICEVFTEFTRLIEFSIGLNQNIAGENDTDEEEICKYPIADYFNCRITPEVAENLTKTNKDCHPIVICEIHDPYNNIDSLLKKSQCDYGNVSFWMYLSFRSIGDIFTTAAVTLLATAVVIATRETSTGRGDVGKQFAAGALGFGIFAPIIGGPGEGNILNSMICLSILLCIATIILLADFKMPLSPPEWWWHTRCGLLALPMSSVRKYGWETAALGLVLFLLGLFWNGADTFLPWHVVKSEEGDPVIIGLTITVGALPAVIFLIFAEWIVDYCGHSNILILCFVNYICHHLALIYIESASYLLLCEWLEIFTLHIMYVTAVLYLRHLVPRKFTACAQALPVITHFCLGRCFGALIEGGAFSEYPFTFQDVHKGFSADAAVIAIIYFLVYHFWLKPKCAAPVHLPPDPAPAIFHHTLQDNGPYTPLRVYHNSKSKKGHFRY